MGKKVVLSQETSVQQGSDYSVWRQKSKEDTHKIDVRAEPDTLSEDQGFYYVDKQTEVTQKRVHKLLKVAKQILTEQQYKVFDLLVLQCKTTREVAKLMGRSQTRIQQLWDSGRHKLQKAYEDRTHA